MATWITLTEEPDLVTGIIKVTPSAKDGESWQMHVLYVDGQLDVFWSTPEMNLFEVEIGEA